MVVVVVLREVVVPLEVVVDDLVDVVVALGVVVVVFSSFSSLLQPHAEARTRAAINTARNFLIISLTFCLTARMDYHKQIIP